MNILHDIIVDYGPRLGIGIIIFLVSWLIAKLAGRLVLRVGSRLKGVEKDFIHLAATSCKAAVIILGLITSLGTMGVNVSALVAGLGLTGFGLGFALKDALSNLLSGAMILAYCPFKAGDHISVSGCEGEVFEINLRYTVLKKDKETWLIPNSILLNSTVRILDKT